MSASQLGLSTPGKTVEWGTYIKMVLIILAVLAVLIGGFIFAKNFFFGMTTKTLSNGGYNYSFKFYRTASIVYPNGGEAYKYNDNIVAGVQPTNDNLAECYEIGSGWTKAFTTQIDGSTRPACVVNSQAFGVLFTALNHNHLFIVTYKTKQDTSVYPMLKTIFSSVKVSQ